MRQSNGKTHAVRVRLGELDGTDNAQFTPRATRRPPPWAVGMRAWRTPIGGPGARITLLAFCIGGWGVVVGWVLLRASVPQPQAFASVRAVTPAWVDALAVPHDLSRAPLAPDAVAVLPRPTVVPAALSPPRDPVPTPVLAEARGGTRGLPSRADAAPIAVPAPAPAPRRRTRPPATPPGAAPSAPEEVPIRMDASLATAPPPRRRTGEVLVAFKDAETIVVPDQYGMPTAFRVGQRLPSGARLVKVNRSAGSAETDRGLLQLE